MLRWPGRSRRSLGGGGCIVIGIDKSAATNACLPLCGAGTDKRGGGIDAWRDGGMASGRRRRKKSKKMKAARKKTSKKMAYRRAADG